MSYPLSAYRTPSFWRHALFSSEPLARVLAAVGGLYLFVEALDFFGIFTRDEHSAWTPVAMVLVSVVYVVITRRPVSRVKYKIPKKDFSYEVVIGDLFESDADIVISSNTTFDTDIASGRISPNSLQGQLAERVFNCKTDEIDRHINNALRGKPSEEAVSPGKKRRYPIGTVVKLTANNRNYYLLAMAELNQHGNAYSDPEMIDAALRGLWDYVAQNGELRDIAIPLVGTGRGRLGLPRKKIVERIAQSFADASRDRVFANKLIIVVRPQDAENFDVNLFEIRDYLTRSLHVA